MTVHSGTVIHEQRFRHERGSFASAPCDVLCNVFVHLKFVCHSRQLVEAHIDFGLAGSRHLVMVHFNLDTDALER